jgi:hypothetical protein
MEKTNPWMRVHGTGFISLHPTSLRRRRKKEN